MKAKYLYIISALTLGLVSCHESDIMPNIERDRTMSFNIVGSNAQTRVQNDIFEAEDKIGVYVTDYINGYPAPLQVSGNRANNEGVVYDGEKWAAERPIYWGEGKSDVYAYYPYISNVTDVDELPFSIATDQDVDGAYEASDLLWAKAEGVAESDDAVQLEMKHTMSRLVVRIMAGEDYKGSLPKDATVHLHSTVTDVLFSFNSGSVVKDPYAGAKSIKMHNLGIRTFADGEAVVYEAIVAPQMLLGTVPLLEINSKSVSYLLEDSFNFKPSTSYTYTAVLNSSTTSIKIDIGCEMDDWNNIGGGSGDNEGGEGGSEGDIDLSGYIDLSAEGTANCYLVQASGNYKFKATLGNTEYSVGNVKKTEVLWETFGTDVIPNVGDLIASTGYQNGYIYFSTAENFNNGNASIAARNSKGTILWSWHIWCTAEGWNDHIYANNAGVMMDRNLGATSATPGNIGALGLLYQWGRKDPFIGASSLSNTTFAKSTGVWSDDEQNDLLFADKNPTVFIKNWSGGTQQNGGWSALEFAKSMYDPCPQGYRVPNGGDYGFWKIAYVNVSVDKIYPGIYFTLADGEKQAWYPYTGYITSGMTTSSMELYYLSAGFYWYIDPNYLVHGDHHYSFKVYAYTGTTQVNINFREQLLKKNALCIRCVKE